MNYEYEIIQINKRLDVENYISEYICDNQILNKFENKYLYNLYFEELKKSLDQSDIYITKFYLIVSYNGKIDNIERIIQKLSKIGCTIERVTSDSNIENILYETLNKSY